MISIDGIVKQVWILLVQKKFEALFFETSSLIRDDMLVEKQKNAPRRARRYGMYFSTFGRDKFGRDKFGRDKSRPYRMAGTEYISPTFRLFLLLL
jgi:hypothetical protein